jgi:hypothetical protein
MSYKYSFITSLMDDVAEKDSIMTCYSDALPNKIPIKHKAILSRGKEAENKLRSLGLMDNEGVFVVECPTNIPKKLFDEVMLFWDENYT